MVAEAARRLASYEDLLRLPEGERAEVIGGELLLAPAPLPRHSLVLARLLPRLNGYDEGGGDRGGPGGWWILPEVDVRFSPHDIVRPDLAGWRRERLPEPWDERPIDVVPDWVCEVLSPSTSGRDRGPKMALYGRGGVEHVWLLDPQHGLLEAFRRARLQDGEGAWVLLGAWERGATVRLPPFEEAELEVAALFPPRAEEPDASPPG